MRQKEENKRKKNPFITGKYQLKYIEGIAEVEKDNSHFLWFRH